MKRVKTIKKRKAAVELEAEVTKKKSPEDERAEEIRNRINTFFENVNEAYVGCGQLIDVIKKTMLSGRHLLISGGHGIAKSKITRNCFRLVSDARQFQTTMTKEQVSEEILGPVIVDKLKEGVLDRNVEGYLPDAHFAFTDELFRASTALFPSMFEILNERTLTIGRRIHQCNLHTCIAAANFSVTDEELAAFLDRFHIQFHMRGIAGVSNISRLLSMFNEGAIGYEPKPEEQITLEEFEFIRNHIERRQLSSRTIEALVTCIERFNRDNPEFTVSPRRMTDAVAYAKACSFIGNTDGKLDCLEDLFAVMVPEERQKGSGDRNKGSLSSSSKGTVDDWQSVVANVVESYAQSKIQKPSMKREEISNPLSDTVTSFDLVVKETMEAKSSSVAMQKMEKVRAILDLIREAYEEVETDKIDCILSGAPDEMTCCQYKEYAESKAKLAEDHVSKLKS